VLAQPDARYLLLRCDHRQRFSQASHRGADTVLHRIKCAAMKLAQSITNLPLVNIFSFVKFFCQGPWTFIVMR
jgi:hypothetical protein